MKILKRSKQVVNFLKENLKNKKALVVMHDNPDPDCIACGICLQKIFEGIYATPTTLTYGGVIGRSENKKMVTECDVILKRIDTLKLDDYTFIVSVDSQPGSGNTSLKLGHKIDMVLDHHPRKTTTRNIPWVDIRTNYGATATIAYEYCMAHNLEFNKLEATAILYALKTETKDLGVEAGPADKRAYLSLLPKSDFEILFNIVHAEVSKDYFLVLAKAMENARIYNDVMVTSTGEIKTPEYVAEVADMLLRLKGVDWTFVSGQCKSSLYMSIRTSNREANSGEIMQQVVNGFGTGGGHDSMAGGKIEKIPENTTFEEIEEELAQRTLRALKKRSHGEELLEEKKEPPEKNKIK